MEEIKRIFETGEECELRVENVHGKTQVIGWDHPRVEVTAVQKDSGGDTEVEIGGEGKRVWAHTRAKSEPNVHEWLGAGAELSEVDYTIYVPRSSEVSLKAINGSIEATELIGSVHAKAVNGSIALRKIQGSIVSKTTNGAIEGNSLMGKAGLTTVSGGISIRDSQLESFSAKTVSGSTTVETSLDDEGSYQVKSISGNFDLVVPEGTGCAVTADVPSGSVECSLPYEERDRGPGQWRATVGDGGATVDFSTISGILRIRQQDGEAGPSEVREDREGPQPSAESAEITILRAIESGELSVDEALDKLENFSRSQ